MKSLLLVGGGGHCHSCIDVIEATGMHHIEGVVQAKASSELVLGYPVIGSDDDLPQLLKSSNLALITVGQIKTVETRIRLFDLVKQLGAELPVVISPKAYCSKHAVLGYGSIIMHGAIVNAGARIGNNCIVNSQALVEHDVEIGDHCHISTGARVNGNVTLGKGSFIGSGAVIKEGVSIGENVVIGAGQVVLRDVPSVTVVKHVY
jgi:sugar O-acyltransferase (sialic acid O-acetyltransferase NeuD family)